MNFTTTLRDYAAIARTRARRAATDTQQATLTAAALLLDSAAHYAARGREDAALEALLIAENYATSHDAGDARMDTGFAHGLLDALTA